MYGSEEIVGPVSIGAKEFRLVASGGHAGDVVDDVLVPYRVGQGGHVVQIARDLPNPKVGEEFGFAGGADQRGDFIPIPNQGFDEMTPDEPRRPGHQRLHTGRSYMR
jgi:hypothetical protein